MISDKKSRKTAESAVLWLKKHSKLIYGFISFLLTVFLWWIIWYIAAKRVGISFILPSPSDAFSAFFELLPQKKFLFAVGSSMLRVICGYIIGAVVGTVAAFLSYFIFPLKSFFSPFMKVVRATPVASFILICVLWMTSEIVPVFISFLMVFPIVYENVLTGLAETDVLLKEAVRVYGFSPFKSLTALYIPSSMPYLGSACITSLGLAWKASVSAEVLCVTKESVGYYIYTSKLYFETEQLFAWTIAIIIMSVILEYAVKLIAKYAVRLSGRRYGK